MKSIFKFQLFVALFCSLFLNAQNEKSIDSLLKAYRSQKEDSLKVLTAYAIYDYHKESNPKTALRYSLEGLQLAKKINYKSGIAKSYYHQGVQFRINRNMDSALFYINKSIKIFEELGDAYGTGLASYQLISIAYLKADYHKALLAIDKSIEKYTTASRSDSILIMNLLRLRASVYMRQTEYENGFAAVLKALDYTEKLKIEDKILQVKGTLASLYHYTDNFEKSIAIKKELLAAYRNQNNKRKIALSLNDIGNSNYVIENYDIALPYLEESLVVSKEINDHGLIGITLFNIGKTHVRKGQVQKGIRILKESIDYSRNVSHNPLSESWALKRLGDVYNEELNSPKKALPYLNRAIQLADSIGNKDDLNESYRDRSQVYAALGHYKLALQDHEMHKAISDTIYNIEKSKEIERLKTEFETKEKEQQIAIQKNEISLLEQQAEIDNLQKLVLGGGLGLSILLFGLGFYGIRQKMKRNKIEKEKVDAELAFKKKELTTHALHLAKKNETLEGLKQKAQELTVSENEHGFKQLIRSIDFDLQDDNNWENFARYFEEVHKDFNGNVKSKYPEVTSNELRLLALLKMNLSSKEIANILNISAEGIKKARYRLRKKLDLQTEDSLQDLAINL